MSAQLVKLKTWNEELDRRLEGFPMPTLTLIEGPNDSGKSVLVQLIAYGALRSGLRVRYVTTENKIPSLLSQLESLTFNVTPYFIRGQLKITELHAENISWNKAVSRFYLQTLIRLISNDELSSLFVIDSLTYLVTHANKTVFLEFFSTCRNFVDKSGKTLFITLHPYAFEQEQLIRVRSICDGHISISIREMRDKTVRVMDVAKLRGASKTTGSIITFEVNPAFGIKILPFSQAKA